MAPLQSRHELAECAELLVSHAIRDVRYLGWWKDAPEEPGAFVEYVEVTMDDGAVLRVTADADDFGSYGISIYEGAYPGPDNAIHVFDASSRAGWRPLIGAVVSAANIGWAELEVTSVRTDGWPARPVSVGTERVEVPCELSLQFQGGGSVLLTAASWMDDGTLTPECENVAVVFGESDAERLKVGRWRPGALP